MSEPREDSPPSSADSRMADLLAESGQKRLSEVRKELREESTGESEDLLSRMNALDYLDSVVGQVSSDLPQRLGEYRITGLLGRGGMGTVFEAFQESLEREVALKILAPTLTADPGMRRRFRTEARANAALHHQHIIPVYGFGEAGGFLYFTMERVDGVSLDKHISAARHRGDVAMQPLEAARRFAGVADALGHAHKRGVYHRDIKPGNILVHPDGELALADFGLSKMLGDASVSVSRAGFLGTLHYASPEQAKGEPAGPSSDLYSLGVTMFEVMTGHLPLAGKTTEAILQSLLHGTPRRLREFLPK
ncbi:MAG: serine/threonine-protein kinase, partial [Planctomycetota bacterium]